MTRFGRRRAIFVCSLVALVIAGCSPLVQFHEPVDNLGKRIVRDVEQTAGVERAMYEYGHGVDTGDRLTIWVDLEKRSETLRTTVISIASKDYWTSGVRLSIPMKVLIFVPDKPIKLGGPKNEPGNRWDAKYDIDVDLENKTIATKLEKRYGPRPSDPVESK